MLSSLLLTAVSLAPLPQGQTETLSVVTSLPYIADVARLVGGDLVEAKAIVAPGVDPHFVELTPAQLTELRQADLFLENGMQLEAWAPKVLEASGRADLAQGGKGHAFVTNGIVPREIPTAAELEAGGHVHAAGNPHVWLDPLNLKVVAGNIAEALGRVAPEHRDTFQERRVAFDKRIDAAFFGEELERLLGGRVLSQLHSSGKLNAFLEGREVRGQKLSALKGGWLQKAEALGPLKVFTYHSTWTYFEESFGFQVVATLEEKPGIPPGPAYLEELRQLAERDQVNVILSPPYYPTVRTQGFAERIEGDLLILPTQPGETEGIEDVFAMFDAIFNALQKASHQG